MARKKELNLVKVFPSSKEAVTAVTKNIVEQVKEGLVDPLEVKVMLTAMERIIDGVKDEIKDEVLNECDRYGSKTFEAKGARVSVSSKTTYTYDHCEDWLRLKVEKGVIDEKMKAIQKQLQVADKNGYLDQSTGELIEHACPSKVTRVVTVSLQ